ncbi:hypothetical protein NL676_007970 [Syzygium grande]|nr:hypothetical protein NL676_007970 [Syzygium grande]
MVGNGGLPQEPRQFKVAYDKLFIAAGAEPLTFCIKGVKEHAYFPREVNHAQEIRKKFLSNLMLSENPGISEEERKRLLHCVVIGGGPTGVEFSSELSDFIMKDVHEGFPHVKDYIQVTLIEANEILLSFDFGLWQYATNHPTIPGVCLKRGMVKEVHAKKIVLNDGTDVLYGLQVQSTGVGPSEFVKSLDLPKFPGVRIGVDEWLRVLSVENVFALGYCAGFLEQTGRPFAEREWKFLVELFRRIGKQNGGKVFCSKDVPLGGLVDLRQSKDGMTRWICELAGLVFGLSHRVVSWLVWCLAYLTG